MTTIKQIQGEARLVRAQASQEIKARQERIAALQAEIKAERQGIAQVRETRDEFLVQCKARIAALRETKQVKHGQALLDKEAKERARVAKALAIIQAYQAKHAPKLLSAA